VHRREGVLRVLTDGGLNAADACQREVQSNFDRLVVAHALAHAGRDLRVCRMGQPGECEIHGEDGPEDHEKSAYALASQISARGIPPREGGKQWHAQDDARLVDEKPESNRQGGHHDTAGKPSQGRRPEQRNDGQIGAAAVLSPAHHERKGHHCEHDAANDGRLKPREQQREDAGHTESAREVKGDRGIDRVGGKHSRQTASQPPVNRAEVGEIHRQGRGLVLQQDFSQQRKLVVAPGRVEEPPRSSQKQCPE
jgi:hypothetical protein